MEAVRVDKWLWAARFYKTRALATEAVLGGHVQVNGLRVKPAKDVRVGDALQIRIGTIEWIVDVRGLAERRGPATVAGPRRSASPRPSTIHSIVPMRICNASPTRTSFAGFARRPLSCTCPPSTASVASARVL